MKATIEVEVPTEFVEARLAEIQADMESDHAAGGPEPEVISAEEFLREIVSNEFNDGGIVTRGWGEHVEVRVEVVSVER